MYFLVFVLFLVLKCDGANILGVVLHTAYSHQIAFRPLWKELSLRGHKVTVLTSDPINDPSLTNLTEIDLSVAYDTWRSTDIIEYSEKNSAFNTILKIFEIGDNVIDVEMSLPQVQDLLHNGNHSFDLVIAEMFYPISIVFSEKFNCPLVAAVSLDGTWQLDELVGNFGHLILSPSILLRSDHPLNFIERLTNVIAYTAELSIGWFYESHFKNLVRKHFGDGYPTLKQIFKQRLSLLVCYFNIATGNVRPFSPATIALGGGTHIEAPKPLPEDLKKFLDNATEGALYFSLGSNHFGRTMALERRNVIIEALAEVPFKVLWKFEIDDTGELPKNVKVKKWVPQQDVLRHQNLKVFVTQGGLQSMEEALATHVPLVVIPKLGDQYFNAKRAVRKGMGLSMDFEKFTKQELIEAIVEVASNSKFRNKMKELDDFARDQPMKPLDKAVWWMEYVIRNNGNKYLNSDLIGKRFFYNMFQPDVMGVLIITLIVISILTFKTLKFLLLCLLFHKKGQVENKKC